MAVRRPLTRNRPSVTRRATTTGPSILPPPPPDDTVGVGPAIILGPQTQTPIQSEVTPVAFSTLRRSGFSSGLTGPGASLPGSGSGSGLPVSGVPCTILQAAGFPCSTTGAIDALRAGINVVTGSGSSSGSGFQPAAGCQPGFEANKSTGVCEFIGSPGEISTRGGGGATMGMFGAPAVAATIVGEIQGSPIRKCPRGTVLGLDDLCYAKGSIPRKYRKWKPARRAPVTAADAAAIRKAESAKGRVKRLAGAVGFSCKKK